MTSPLQRVHAGLTAGLWLAAAVSAAAQSGSLGVRGGLTSASQSQRFIGQQVDNSSVTEYHVGLTSRLDFNEYVSLRPELIFSRRGVDNPAVFTSLLSYTDRLSYLTLPVTVAVQAPLGPAHGWVGAGGYAAALLGGTREERVSALGTTATRTRDFKLGSASQDDYRQFDGGLQFTAGVGYRWFFASANYALGLADVQSQGDDNNYRRTRCLEVSAGAYFSGSGARPRSSSGKY